MLLTARYVLPIASPHIEHGAVLVRGDSIVEVGEFEHLEMRYPEEPVKDFGLAVLMPGFVDLHTHLEYSAMRGLVDDVPYSEWKLQLLKRERKFSLEDWDDSALLGALEALQSGITTICDITRTGASARAALKAGLRGHIYREVATMEKANVPRIMESAIADIEAWRAMNGHGALTVGIAPHAPYSCHPELFLRVAEYAADGTPVSTHLAGSVEEYQFVKYGSSGLARDVRDTYDQQAPVWLPTGVSPVRYVLQWDLLDIPNILAVHCTQLDPDDLDVLAEYDVAVASCPRSEAKLGMGIGPIGQFLDKGIRVGLGTDSPAMSNATDVFEEMRIGLLLQRAVLGHAQFMNAKQFVTMATLDAAKALRIDDKVGSLEAGKQADIIAVDLSGSHQIPTHNPYSTLVHTANQESILATMVAGEFLYEDRKWRSLDHESIFARAEEMRLKLRS